MLLGIPEGTARSDLHHARRALRTVLLRHLDGRMMLDRRILRALKAEYAGPRDPGYWAGLEAQIMARVNSEDDWSWAFRTWGSHLAGRCRGCALIALGVTAWRERVTERQLAYETVVDSKPALPVQLRRRLVDGSQRDATLRYVYGY